MDRTTRTIEMVERLARLVAAEGHAHGLKPAQWETLRYLSRANRFSRTPGALAAYLGSTKGTVSQTVMSLERAGLLEKTANPDDARSVRLDLSANGRALLPRDDMAAVRLAFETLPQTARVALDGGVEALLDAMLAARGGRAFGVCRTCRHYSADAGGQGRHYCRLLEVPLADEEAGKICIEQRAAA